MATLRRLRDEQEVDAARRVLAASRTPSRRRRPAPPGPGTCPRCRPRTPSGRTLLQQLHLGVVRRDDHDVVGAERARRAVAVGPRARRAAARSRSAIALRLLVGLGSSCRGASTGSQRMPVPTRAPLARARGSPNRAGPRRTLRDEVADVRVHPPVARGRGPCPRRHRRASPRRCSSTRAPAPPGWTPCVTCGELHRVAEEDERPRARAERERVGERELAGLVDEEVVERARRAPRA